MKMMKMMKKTHPLVVGVMILALVPGCLENNTGYTTDFDINGMKVVFRKTSGETASAAMFLKGGVMNLNESTQGMENLLFRLAVKESENYSKEALNANLLKMGGQLEVDVNMDYTAIYLASPAEHFNELWDVFVDVLLNPLLDEEEFLNLKEQLIAEAKLRQDHPDSKIWDIAGEKFFEKHPYSLEPRGTVESLSGMELQDIRDYHKQGMETSRLLLVIAAPEPEKHVERMCEKAFGNLPKGDYKEKRVPVIENVPGLNVERRDTATNYVVGYWRGPASGSEEYYKTKVAAEVLKYFMWGFLREEVPLAYEVSAGLENNAAGHGYLYITTRDPEIAVQLMFLSVQILVQGSFSNPEDMQNFIDSVVYTMKTEYYSSKESVLYQTLNLGRFELLGGGWECEEDYISNLEAVKARDMGSSLLKWVRNISFGMLGPTRVSEEYFRGLDLELVMEKLS
jgi:predicted Zn-dependent peptidase